MSKKKGLRSIRRTVSLLVIILILPLIVSVMLKIFLISPPICPEYSELVKEARSSENGYIDFKEAINISEKICCGYFMPIAKITFPECFKDKYIDKGRYCYYLLADYYKYLIKEGRLREEFDFYSKNYKYFEAPVKIEKLDCISPKNEWKSDLLNDSQDVLKNIKKMNEINTFVFYFEDYYEQFSDWTPLWIIEFTNIFLYLEKGDYKNAKDWLDTSIQSFVHAEMLSGSYSIMMSYLREAINPLLFSQSLPDTFYEHLVGSLIEAKEKFKLIDFKTVYKNWLFNVENELILDKTRFIEDRRRYRDKNYFTLISNLFSALLSYNDVARILDKYRVTFESSTWKDLKDAAFYNRGILSKPINELKLVKKRENIYEYELSDFLNGTIWERMALMPDWALCHFYNSIIIALLEQYYVNHGEYPVSLQEIACYFTEEELISINEYFDISMSSQNYCIVFKPDPNKKMVYKNLYCHWNMVE